MKNSQLTTCLMGNSENFPLKIKIEIRVSVLATSTQHGAVGSIQANQQENKIKGTLIVRKG